MCLICVDLIKQKMTLPEAQRNASEMNLTRSGSDHYAELEKAIKELDLEKLGQLLDENEKETNG
jgi:mevalonate kinase